MYDYLGYTLIDLSTTYFDLSLSLLPLPSMTLAKNVGSLTGYALGSFLCMGLFLEVIDGFQTNVNFVLFICVLVGILGLCVLITK